MIGVCNSNSLGIMQPGHTLFSVNGSELNAGASLSDDSGVTLTTNSSISSGDSFQLDMCKYEIDLIESDGEASFHSFDNCSVGGMSTENFNTLKRGPLAPIDPPLEFQDSPKTTLVRSMGDNANKPIKRWSFSKSSFESSEETADKFNTKEAYKYDNTSLQGDSSTNKHLYSSDSILNTYTDNIYDEPNNIISTSLGNCIDLCESKSTSSFTSYVPNIDTHSICSYHNENNKCLQACLTNHSHISTTGKAFSFGGHFELNCGTKKKSATEYVGSSKRKVLKSPPYNSYQYNGHHYIAGSCSCGNRAHSKNSLNSRLSSSHNSLCVPKTNKADDSIFITQAMSHDALMTQEISDFYNVPIDSDIYAFPIDMITSKKEYIHKDKDFLSCAKEVNIIVQSHDTLVHRFMKHNDKNTLSKANRIKDVKELNNGSNKINIKTKKSKHHQNQKKLQNALKAHENVESIPNEPLHMTLEEVQQYYQTLYSGTTKRTDRLKNIKNNAVSSSKNANWSLKSNADNANANSVKDETISNNLSSFKKLDCDANIIYNNQVTISSHNNVQNQAPNIKNNELSCKDSLNQQTNQVATTSKQTLQADKKSQFNLNIKQKLCSIFRFRKSVNRCVNSSASDEYMSHSDNTSHLIEDKKNKFQSRALPPLPKLAETKRILSCEYIEQGPELQTYHFTSSIEKVKDYGWYWGPLSSEAAENILSNEPDGSFIVRDSSDDHYIFSLSFKLSSCVRHVRIEQDQGTFSFGSYAKFKSQTITEFIEKAVDHSRSGR